MRSRIPRTKTFDGCWTCRRRKVKCHGPRPICQRCVNANLLCEGFDAQLCWEMEESSRKPIHFSPNSNRRRIFIPQGKKILTLYTAKEVNLMINSMEERSAQGDHNITNGPFSVFELDDSSPQCRTSPSSNLALELLQERYTPDFPRQNSGPANLGDQTSDDNRSLCNISTLDDEHDVPNQRTSHGHHLGVGLVVGQLENIDYSPHKLMSYYITQLVDLLQPIHHPQNPFLTIYVQSAMSGLFTAPEQLNRFDPTNGPMRGNMSVFHSLIATSAFHIRGHRPMRDSKWMVFDQIGRINRLKALKYLQEAIKESSVYTKTPYMIVAAILCQVTADIMEGSMTEFFTHLRGSEQFRSSHLVEMLSDGQQARGTFTRQLAVNSSFLATLAQTTTHYLPPYVAFPAPSKQASLFDTPFTSADTSLEFTYGITSTTASFIYLTNKFWQCAHFSGSVGTRIPSAISDAIQTLASLITSWTPSSEPFSSIPLGNTATLAIARNLAKSFNYAAQIYFYSCFGLESPFTDRTTLAELSKLTLTVLEQAESDKVAASRALKLDVKGASISWPAFVAACEAPVELRRRWSKYWEILINYRIGNLGVIWEIVKLVWKKTDQKGALGISDGSEPLNHDAQSVRLRIPRWSEILREVGFSILAV